MPSRARIDAGRSVGTLAKGKKFEEACQKCAQNSVKHRLFSKTLVLANESPELFESTRKTYYDLWKPENEFEADLVNDMVAARWCLNRIMMVETEALDLRHASMNHSGELKKEFEIIPGLEGEFVNIRESTALMSVRRSASLITYALAFCDMNGVVLSEPKQPEYA